jgi:hypothetical protein
MRRISTIMKALLPRADLLAIAGLVALILLFLWPALLPGRVLLPLDMVVDSFPPWQQPNRPEAVHNLILGDAVTYIYPVKEFAAAAVRRGELPLWNPYVLGGYPFTYNTQAGLYYPLSLFYYLLPPATAVNLTIIVQMALGALFMYLYLRLLELKRLAAATGAFLFIFNGLMIIWLEWQVVHAAVIWLPLQLYFAERLARAASGQWRVASNSQTRLLAHSQSLKLAVLCGISLALPWLGGHWNWALYAGLTLAVYLVWRLGPSLLRAQTRPERLRLAALIGLPLLVGLGLSLVQVLPAALYLSQSHREALPFAESMRYGLLNRLVALLIPNFFGDPITRNWWGHSNYAETTFYSGILPLLLGGLALWLRRDGISLFFAAWGLLGFLWALGTPVYGLLYILPVFGGLLPSRAAFLVLFCLAVLSALALDRLMDEPITNKKAGSGREGAAEASPETNRLLVVTAVLVALSLSTVAVYTLYYRQQVSDNWDYLRFEFFLLGLFLLVGSGLLLARLQGRLPPPVAAPLIFTAIVLDLFVFGYGYNSVGEVADLYPPTETAVYLQSDPEPFRIVTLASGTAYQPNSSLVPRIANISGYEPGILKRILNYMNAAEGDSTLHSEREVMPLQAVDTPMLDVLNVKYIVTTDDRWQQVSLPAIVQEPVDAWLPLAAGAPLNQPFTMPDAGLHRLDLWLRAAPGAAGTVTVRVQTADAVLELAHATLSVAGELAAGWHSFYFGAFPSEWGREFRVMVAFEGAGEIEIARADPATTLVPASVSEGLPLPLALVVYYLPRPNLVHEEGKTRIYQRQSYFPRAFAVHQAIVARNEEESLANVLAHQHELDRLLILELPGEPPPVLDELPAQPSTVAVMESGLNRVFLSADMAADGYVVLADVYYPGWQATVNGERTAVYRANSILRAVYVPAGQHTIVFSFRPPDFFFGALVSLLTLAACGTLLFHRRHRPAGQPN